MSSVNLKLLTALKELGASDAEALVIATDVNKDYLMELRMDVKLVNFSIIASILLNDIIIYLIAIVIE